MIVYVMGECPYCARKRGEGHLPDCEIQSVIDTDETVIRLRRLLDRATQARIDAHDERLYTYALGQEELITRDLMARETEIRLTFRRTG